jgi:hypothetical protein
VANGEAAVTRACSIVTIEVICSDEGAVVALDDDQAALIEGSHRRTLQVTEFPQEQLKALAPEHVPVLDILSKPQGQIHEDHSNAALRHALADMSCPGHPDRCPES